MLWFIVGAHVGFVISSLIAVEVDRSRSDRKDAEIARLRAELEKAKAESAEMRKWVPYRKGVLVMWGDN